VSCMSDKKITIYTSPTCHFCKVTKEFFKENNIEYTEYDVVHDAEKRNEMIKRSGQMGVPVTFVSSPGTPEDQAELIIGFDKPKLSELLGIKE